MQALDRRLCVMYRRGRLHIDSRMTVCQVRPQIQCVSLFLAVFLKNIINMLALIPYNAKLLPKALRNIWFSAEYSLMSKHEVRRRHEQ